MAQFVGAFMVVREVVRQAEQQGCEVRVAKFKIVTGDGQIPVRYLHNKKTGGNFDFTHYADDEGMGPSIQDLIQRRLGIILTPPED